MSGQKFKKDGKTISLSTPSSFKFPLLSFDRGITDASHFAYGLNKRSQEIQGGGLKKPLLLFSGDLFGQSFDSSLAKGMNMVTRGKLKLCMAH